MHFFARPFCAVILILFMCLASAPAAAHPHAFVDAKVTIIFDDHGLAGFHEHWVLDEMTTMAVMDLIGAFGAETLTPEMVEDIRVQSMGNIKEFGYFTDIRIDGKRFAIQWIKDFNASLDKGRLTYEFTVPCHVKASATLRQVKIAVYDDSFYTYVNYASDGGQGVNPAMDPMFADPSAPASPGDFERFTSAVGLDGYEGAARLEGPLDGFRIDSGVREAPEMIYFYEQIVPQAFVVSFQRK